MKFLTFSKKQKQLLTFWHEKSPHKDKFMVIADGAIRSGKTVSMIISFILWSLKSFKGEKFIIAGKSVGSLKRNVLEPMFSILKTLGIKYKYHRSDHVITIGTNKYYCFGANNESSQDVLQGMTAAGAFADEIALFPRSFVDQMIGRCSVKGRKIFVNCNPNSPYHWFKTEYIDKKEEKNILYLHFTMEDNLSLDGEIKEGYRKMFSGVFYKRYICGLWVMAEGIIYDMFDDKVHKVKSEKRKYEKYYISIDYGTQNACVFLLWGLFHGKWYIVKEYYYSGREKGKQKTDVEYSKDLKDFIGDISYSGIIIDPSSASFIAQLKKDGFKSIKKAKNDVEDGIRNVSTSLSNLMIFVCDDCSNTLKEFYTYVWDEKAGKRGEDKPIKQNDHAMDGIRYFCNTILFKKKSAFVAMAGER